MFPRGVPGCGLALLRMLVALSLHLDVAGHLVENPRGLEFAALLALSGLIVAGLLTPVVAVLCAVAQAALLLTGPGPVPPGALTGPVDTLLLVLLGPGAYSFDAHLFGRRVLVAESGGGGSAD